MNWEQRLEKLIDGSGDADEATNLADAWNTCVVGECMGLEGMSAAEAYDTIKERTAWKEIMELGNDFAKAISNYDMDTAKILYQDIKAVLG